MSYEATSVLEREDHTVESDNSYSETIEDWFRPLYDLVVANADVIIRCPWMGGAEVPLSKSMWSHAEVTPDNVNQVMLEVQQLLADRVTESEQLEEEEVSTEEDESEEPAEEDKPKEEQSAKTEGADQKSNTEAEVQKVEEISNAVAAGEQPKNVINVTADLGPIASRTVKTSEPKNSIVTEVEVGVITKPIQSEPKQFTQNTDKVKPPASSSNRSADRANEDGTGATETLTVTRKISVSSGAESLVDKTGQEFTPVVPSVKVQFSETKLVIKPEVETKQQIPTVEVQEAAAVACPIVEEMPSPVRHPLIPDQEIEITSEPESIELPILALESTAISDEITELDDEKIELVVDESVLLTLDYQTDANGLIDFVEEEVLHVQLEQTGLEPNELYEFSNLQSSEVIEDNLEVGETLISQLDHESSLSEQMEISSPEQPILISLNIEEIEDSLIQLTERIATNKAETIQNVDEVLDKIIEVSVKFEVGSSENIITETEAQEELEKLFTELLDKVDIDYTPDLIESLARLTFKWHLAGELEKLKNEEETDNAPQDRGTHEIIKKLLVGLSIIKKAMAHASSIGRSALRLYTVNLAT